MKFSMKALGAFMGCAMFAGIAAAVEPCGDIAAGFRDPPPTARPHVWWHWMNGNVAKAGITADLEAMAEIGIGGAQIFDIGLFMPPGPVAFDSEAWYDSVEHAVREARPADPCANRRRICDLRLTSQSIAVHSDMLVWSKDETPEGAALPILNALFSTIQYSMVLAKINPEHKRIIRHWIEFSRRHRDALLKGRFTPHHAENGYTWIEGECASERVVASYSQDVVVRSGAADKSVILVNATGANGMLVELSSMPSKVELFDVFGMECGDSETQSGIVRLPVPASGYAVLRW